MKKILSAVLALIVFSSLVACKANNSNENSVETNDVVEREW